MTRRIVRRSMPWAARGLRAACWGLAAVTTLAAPVGAQRTVAAESSAPAVIRAGDVLARPVTIQLDRVPLKQALTAIADSAAVMFQYRGATISGVEATVTLHATKLPLGRVLDQVLAGTALQAVPYSADVVTIVRADAPMQQPGVISGRVINAKTKQPVIGATIVLDDKTSGALAGPDGAYRTSAAAGSHRVTVRALGFVKQSREVTVASEQNLTADFTLEPSTSVLDEVVVTGTVVATERKAIPNPITVITAEEIEKRGITRVEQLLRGQVPGAIAADQGNMTYSSWNGVAGMASSTVFARGVSAFGGGLSGAAPLKTYIDGVELVDPKYLGTIDPRSIERIEIVTGPQAATVYGSGAIGGVMQIFTKRGSGNRTPDFTLSIKYGMLQTNVSSGLTPTHNDVLSMTGGSGPEFSYSGTLSYDYSGQWQPFLYSRRLGSSLGATHKRGQLTIDGSASITTGQNGTFSSDPSMRALVADGDQQNRYAFLVVSPIRGKQGSLLLSLGVDYAPMSFWQHHVTAGRSQANLALDPTAPQFSTVSDSLFKYQSRIQQRTTVGYNTTLTPAPVGPLSTTLTLGATAASGDITSVSACLANGTSVTYVACSIYETVTVTRGLNGDSRGVFGSWRIGLFDRLYATIGLRGERNQNYGESHKVDWTPTNGVTFTMERNDLTLKLLGSYGRATKAPDPNQRLPQLSSSTSYDPGVWLGQLSNPDLRPSYSRGPQGGFELYYGNRFSLTLNRYVQLIDDFILSLVIDSVQARQIATGQTIYLSQIQYRNAGSMRLQGWESTGSVNVGPLSLRGTYSYNDSRTRAYDRRYLYGQGTGQAFSDVPSPHFGNLTASYAYGPTSIILSNNFMGKTLSQISNHRLASVYQNLYPRLNMYNVRAGILGYFVLEKAGYAKSDLSVSHRLTQAVSFTMNVQNIGNVYDNDIFAYSATLGRQTSLGVTLRYPNR